MVLRVAPALQPLPSVNQSNNSLQPDSDKSVGDFNFSPTRWPARVSLLLSSWIVGGGGFRNHPEPDDQDRAAGTATITASQAGNGSLDPAPVRHKRWQLTL